MKPKALLDNMPLTVDDLVQLPGIAMPVSPPKPEARAYSPLYGILRMLHGDARQDVAYLKGEPRKAIENWPEAARSRSREDAASKFQYHRPRP